MFNEIKAKVLDVERKLDKAWVRLFPDVVLSEREIVLTRHVVLATLRGLSLRNTYRREQSASSEEIEILKDVIVRKLTSR
jgi:hypothetical protein